MEDTEGRLRQELDQLQQQLAEVKHVDDQELDKLWLLASERHCLAAWLDFRQRSWSCWVVVKKSWSGLDTCRGLMPLL